MDRESLVIWGSLLAWLGGTTLFLVMMRSLLARLSRVFHTRMRTSLEAAEFIIRTGQAPPAWQQRLLPTDPWSSHLQAVWDCLGTATWNRQALCLSRLEHLIHFFESSPVVQGTETRTLLLAELRAQYEHWRQHGVSIAPEPEAGDDLPTSMSTDDGTA